MTSTLSGAPGEVHPCLTTSMIEMMVSFKLSLSSYNIVTTSFAGNCQSSCKESAHNCVVIGMYRLKYSGVCHNYFLIVHCVFYSLLQITHKTHSTQSIGAAITFPGLRPLQQPGFSSVWEPINTVSSLHIHMLCKLTCL